jgi:TetR/AcrR family transcriptional regulator, regulator of cefoperazone and chloramphenicol sensitivity
MEPTRQRILEAAGEIFAEKGFRETTVREICQAAEVNLASVNYHFRDKESLYIETVRAAHERNVTERPLPEGFEAETAERRLYLFIFNLLQRMIGTPDSHWENRLLLSEVIQPTRACEALVESAFRPHFLILQDILAELTACHPTSAETRRLAFSVIGQCLFYRVAGRTAALIVGDPLRNREQAHSDAELESLAWHITMVSLAGAQAYAQQAAQAFDAFQSAATMIRFQTGDDL